MGTPRYTAGTPFAERAGRCAWIVALFLWSPLAGAAADPPEPLPENDSPESRALRPLSRPTRLLPAPRITYFAPRDEIIAGGTIVLHGSDLRPAELVVRLGTRRPVTLRILRSTSTVIRARVPENVLTPGGPLTAHYPGSKVVTLEESFAVYPRPTFSNPVFRRGPHIGAPTDMDITVTNYSGLENARLVWYSGCWLNGQAGGHLPAGGSTGKIPVSLDIRRYDPALGPTEDLMSVSGRRCSLEVSIGDMRQRLPTGLSIQLPRIAAYTIGKTWELQGYSTRSGKTFRARVAGAPATCEPLSIGTAGTFRIGVVEFENDISFQLRNGLIDLECEYTTSPRLQVREGWRITEVDWGLSLPGNTFCHPVLEWIEFAPGRWGQGTDVNPGYLDRVRTIARCAVDTRNPPRNSHLFRAVLRKVVLVGPPQQSWRAAFR